MIETYVSKSDLEAVLAEIHRLSGWLLYATRRQNQECQCCSIPTCDPCIRQAILDGKQAP